MAHGAETRPGMLGQQLPSEAPVSKQSREF